MVFDAGAEVGQTRGMVIETTRRSWTVVLVAIALTSQACAARKLGQGAEQSRDPIERRMDLETPKGPASPIESVPLPCEEFATYDAARPALVEGTVTRPGDLEPEWRRNGFIVDIPVSNRIRLAFANGYGPEDMSAQAPIPRPWSVCHLPDSYTKDIAGGPSYGISQSLERGIIELQLLDEGVGSAPGGADGPRLEWIVLIDLVNKRVMPKVLCYAATDNSADPSDGCVAQRACGVDQDAPILRAGDWALNSNEACSKLLAGHRPDKDLKGVFSFPTL
jgi:hypothetical protein